MNLLPAPLLTAWNIIGRDAPDDKVFHEEEVARYQELHYNRFTYYPFHDRPRLHRDYIKREMSCRLSILQPHGRNQVPHSM